MDAGRGAETPDATGPDSGLPVMDRGLRLITLNVRCLIDDWNTRREVIAEAFAAIDPDVVGLQEVCSDPRTGRDNASELADALGQRTGRTYAVHRAVTHRAWDAYDEGIALMTTHAVAVSFVGDLPSGVFPRKVVIAALTDPQVVVAATHFDHQDAVVRGAQAQAAAAHVRQQAGADPAFLMGDLNEIPGGGVAIALAAAGFTDAWAQLRPDEPGFTFPASAPNLRIDYIWVWGATVSSIATVLTTMPFGSDHLGVLARWSPARAI